MDSSQPKTSSCGHANPKEFVFVSFGASESIVGLKIGETRVLGGFKTSRGYSARQSSSLFDSLNELLLPHLIYFYVGL